MWHADIFIEEGERGDSKIIHVGDGWFYYFNKGDQEKFYLACVKYHKVGCRGRAIYEAGHGLRHTKEHNDHEPDPRHAEVLSLKRSILNRCRNLDYLPFARIVEEERRRFHPLVAAEVTLAGMRTSMRNARMANYPPVPESLRGLSNLLRDPLYAAITATADGQDNVYGGSVTDANGDHHMLLASRRMLRLMSRMEVIFSDGTFKIVPSLPGLGNRRAQVFNIMSTWRNHTIPLASVIMESRTQEAYEAVFLLLQNLLQQWRFNKVITDSEAAQINAWETIFEPEKMQNCLYHICKAFVIQISELGLGRWFRDPQFPQFTVIVRLACALPLLPPPLLRLGLRIVKREARIQGGAHLVNIMTPFIDYLSVHWVGNDRRRRHMSVYMSQHRTNNICESRNSQMLDILGIHPNIYSFLSGYIEMENTTYVDVLALLRGREVSRARKTSAVVNDRVIRNLSRELRRPAMGLNDAVRRFLYECSRRVRYIVQAHIRDHI